MRILAAFGLSASLGLLSLGGRAAGLPLVISATVDYTHNTLTINGQNFGSNPTVTLDSLAFPTQSSASAKVVANFPSGKAPASFVPGTYFLTVTFKNQLPTIFAVDIGGSGAQGPAGPAGAQGLPGVAGSPGPAGPAGPQGIPGPMGLSGGVGATGAAGATGAQGLQGVAGPVGPQGLQGPAGAVSQSDFSALTARVVALESAAGSGGTGNPPGGGTGGGTMDTDGDGIPDAIDHCPQVPNVFHNGNSYCPASIYDMAIPGVGPGAFGPGAITLLSNVHVDSVQGNVALVSVQPADAQYRGDTYSSVNLDFGTLMPPAVGNRITVFGMVVRNSTPIDPVGYVPGLISVSDWVLLSVN